MEANPTMGGAPPMVDGPTRPSTPEVPLGIAPLGDWLADVWTAKAEKDKEDYLRFLESMGTPKEELERLRGIPVRDLMGDS